MIPVTELLEEVNGNMDNIALYKTNQYVVDILKYAYRDDMKFILPETDPPIKTDVVLEGFGYANFYQEIRKFYIFNRSDLPDTKREGLFISMCESLSPSEVKILMAIKNQELFVLYPKITKEAVQVLIN